LVIGDLVIGDRRRVARGLNVRGAGAVVFGGASGLGEATARCLVEEGADVVIADLAEDRADELADSINARAIRTDVTDPGQVEAAVAMAAEAERGLRVSVVCAGLVVSARLLGRDGPAPLDHFEQVIRVNLLGTINVLRLAAATMGENEPDHEGQRGICIQTASIAAYDGQIGYVAYAASKAGVVGLTLPAARELASVGVRVMTIAPGVFDTPMLASAPESVRGRLVAGVPFPPRLGRPTEYAQLVADIVDNPMLNGEVIRLDASLRLGPR
jgi:NAD(P)-dependent dehydrogenase (short-subunit alcohol dehydrogenase family)